MSSKVAFNTANLVAQVTGWRFELKHQRGYSGWYSWEDEPEDRNPMLIAAEMRQYIERRTDA
jgi:hypothetical protein